MEKSVPVIGGLSSFVLTMFAQGGGDFASSFERLGIGGGIGAFVCFLLYTIVRRYDAAQTERIQKLESELVYYRDKYHSYLEGNETNES